MCTRSSPNLLLLLQPRQLLWILLCNPFCTIPSGWENYFAKWIFRGRLLSLNNKCRKILKWGDANMEKSLICSCSDKRSWESFWDGGVIHVVSKQRLRLSGSELPPCLQSKKGEESLSFFSCGKCSISSIFPSLSSPPRTWACSTPQDSPGTYQNLMSAHDSQ